MMVSPAILVMMTTLAQAAPPPLMTPANAKASAQILLRDGTALFERGEMADALKKFQQAYEIFPSPKILFNVGAAQRVLDHPVEALSAFQRFLAEAPDAPAGARQEAQQAVAALTSSLGRVIVECPEAAMDVSIDGTPVGVTPLAAPIWAVPGQRRIGGRREGMIAAVQDVTVRAGTDSAETLAGRAGISMTARGGVAACAMRCGLLSCQTTDSVVVVSVTTAPGVQPINQLRALMSNGSDASVKLYPQPPTATPLDFTAAPITFAVVVPRSRSGPFDIAVDGLLVSGATVVAPTPLVVASGPGRAILTAGERAVVSVLLLPAPPAGGFGALVPGVAGDEGMRFSGEGCDFRCLMLLSGAGRPA